MGHRPVRARHGGDRAEVVTVFLRLALVNALFAVGLVAARVTYDGHIHAAGKACIVVVLAVYAVAAVYGMLLAYRDGPKLHRFPPAGVRHITLAIKLLPQLALLGSVSGFLIALSGSSEDVQQRVVGAATGLTATFVGISCAVCLTVQRHLIERR